MNGIGVRNEVHSLLWKLRVTQNRVDIGSKKPTLHLNTIEYHEGEGYSHYSQAIIILDPPGHTRGYINSSATPSENAYELVEATGLRTSHKFSPMKMYILP
uniref:Uncharacterized protein n=1 Tax=Vespula pensylvanica TaxID=30213 RepID=A0A834PAI1_VESPE|nr:hypothetical protein H0235_002609 [Vespula pensylvanica]